MVQEELTIVRKDSITGQVYENKFSDTARNARSVCYKTKDSQKSVLVILIRQTCRWNSSAWTWWDLFTRPAAGEISTY